MTLLSARGVAAELGVSARRVCALARQGALSFEPTPLGRLYRVDEVERLKVARRRRARHDRRIKTAVR